MTEFTDEQARERGHRFLVKTSGLEVPVGRALLTLEQKLAVLKDKLTLAYDERDAAEARIKALEAEVERQRERRTHESMQYAEFCAEIAAAADSRVPATAVQAVENIKRERDEAVARCKALEAERDELKQQRQQAVLAVDAWASRFTAAEARLAEAVRALRSIASLEGRTTHEAGAFARARAALAAVDGKEE